MQILYCNIGNPHSLGQQPVTFFREVSLSALDYSFVMNACSTVAYLLIAFVRSSLYVIIQLSWTKVKLMLYTGMESWKPLYTWMSISKLVLKTFAIFLYGR